MCIWLRVALTLISGYVAGLLWQLTVEGMLLFMAVLPLALVLKFGLEVYKFTKAALQCTEGDFMSAAMAPQFMVSRTTSQTHFL
jgi:hypothetical protein